jgi:hypothetical protein
VEAGSSASIGDGAAISVDGGGGAATSAHVRPTLESFCVAPIPNCTCN